MRMWVSRAHLASTKHRQLGRDPGPCLGLFRQFGPRRCKQHPRLIERPARPLGHVVAIVGLRGVRLREFIKSGGIDLMKGWASCSMVVVPVDCQIANTGPGWSVGGREAACEQSIHSTPQFTEARVGSISTAAAFSSAP